MKKYLAPLMATIFAVSISGAAFAQTEITLYSFSGGGDGYYPLGGLILDATGTLYGTSFFGGTTNLFCRVGCGTVFQLLHNGAAWDFRTRYSFKGEPTDVGHPFARLTFDSQGDLYGAGVNGGPNFCFADSCGGIFKLSSSPEWKESVIYFFSPNSGDSPGSGLTLYKGNFYGVTSFGPERNGDVGYGTAYELAPAGGGTWKHTIIHAFHFGLDGYEPSSDLVFDQEGHAYGSTPYGGKNQAGDVFELSRNGHGGWASRLILNGPTFSLIFGPDGNLYGPSTSGSGNCTGACGSIVELERTATGWKQVPLYEFKDDTDGSTPGTVVFDKEGNIYGTTFLGGTGSCQFFQYPGCGTVFKLTKVNGHWHKKTLYNFTGGTDGEFPNGTQLAIDASGNLYGATLGGATFDTSGFGTIYEIQP